MWGGRIVSESTTTSHINAVRKAIGDSGEEQRLIRTVSRKGFRFVGEIVVGPASPVERITAEFSEPPLAPPMLDKPSITVLPFLNLSGDPEQDYFANGVRYVLEGSLRKEGDRVRITGQLLDVSTGAHLWAERFEGTIGNLFELQDQIAESVVGAISPQLERVEIERTKRKSTGNLDAYDYFLRGMAGLHSCRISMASIPFVVFHHIVRVLIVVAGAAAAFRLRFDPFKLPIDIA